MGFGNVCIQRLKPLITLLVFTPYFSCHIIIKLYYYNMVKGGIIMDIRQCFATNNDCYKAGKKIKPTGIVVHSTGTNNSYLKRYVQPDDGLLGKNPNNNHFNIPNLYKCVHAFIGKDKNGTVRIYQTLPWNYRCWGCGKGKKGTYNDRYIQFEICEDGLNDISYFNLTFNNAIELCAYLCKTYNIPVSNIVSHSEAYKKGYASNHADCHHWLKRFGKNMNWFRQQVTAKMNAVSATTQPTTNKVNTPVTNTTGISISQFTPTKGNPEDFNKIIKNIKSALNIDYGLKFAIDSNIDKILLTNLANVVISDRSYKPNITYALHQMMNWWGCNLPLNGVYQAATTLNVAAFQKQFGITQTGTTTKEFWQKLLGK